MSSFSKSGILTDVNKWMNKHYTSGRAGNRINKIVWHHNAGILTVDQIWNVWQTREASAHYQIEKNGWVGRLVSADNTAWHAGNQAANRTSLGIEVSDCDSKYNITNESKETLCKLTAALCHFYGLGRPAWNKNVFPHKYFSATSCPYKIDWEHASLINRAGYFYDEMSKGKVFTNSWAGGLTPGGKRTTLNGSKGNSSSHSSNNSFVASNIDNLAREVIAGKFGYGNERKRRLGSDYNAVQARVNQMLNTGGGHNSVNIDDLARRTIRGEFGNGEQRKRRLGSNYDAVMKRVNELL